MLSILFSLEGFDCECQVWLLLVRKLGGPITNCSIIDFHFRITYLQSYIFCLAGQLPIAPSLVSILELLTYNHLSFVYIIFSQGFDSSKFLHSIKYKHIYYPTTLLCNLLQGLASWLLNNHSKVGTYKRFTYSMRQNEKTNLNFFSVILCIEHAQC